ncbi:MAG TPA: ABC transporter permease [Longimicrobiales bacterium]|nr:ABC transporter permease [Longimicrobiales bacterium]
MRYALRSLARSPGFTALVVLTLALGIGANTAVFSVLRGVLLRPLPHDDGDRLMYLRQSAEGQGFDNALFSVPEILDYREAATSLTGFAEFSAMPFNMLGGDEPVQVQAGIITGNYFRVMGLDAVLGRAINEQDDGAEAAPVMMLTYDYWLNAFGGDPDILGRVLRMNGRSVTIVGVAEPAPPFPDGTDILVNMVTSPHHLDATMVHGRSHRMTEVFARLAPGATLPQAQAELDAIATRVHADHPDAYDPGAGYEITVTPLRTALTADARQTLLLLMATAALVLLTACANAGNLILARFLERERELTLRWALGAGRERLRWLLLGETGILAVAGAAVGLVLAYAGLDLLVGFAARYTPRAAEVSIDGPVLAFTLVVATGSAMAFAFAPSLRSSEGGNMTLLRTGSRSSGGRQRLQRGLVVAQVAAAVTVLTAGGLLTRTLLRLNAVDTGVEMENTLTMQVPADGDSRTADEVLRLQEGMQARIAGLPGVQAVGVGLNVPLRTAGIMLEIKAEGFPREAGTPPYMAEYRAATPDYFRAAGMRIVAGRDFESTDVTDAAPVAILNESLARRLFGDADPLGQRVAWTGDVLQFIGMEGGWVTVVGVVNDTRDLGPDRQPPLALYHPLAQNELGYFPGGVVIRGVDAAALVPEVSRIVRDLTPEGPIEDVATLEQVHEETIAPQRLNALLVGAFGLLALVITGVGIAGVLAFLVARRTTEIGIRMSLGAARARVLAMVLADGGRLLAAGVLIGLAASILVARLLQGLLFGVEALDPLTFGLVSALMVAVGLAACVVPAHRAASVDPLVAMQEE